MARIIDKRHLGKGIVIASQTTSFVTIKYSESNGLYLSCIDKAFDIDEVKLLNEEIGRLSKLIIQFESKTNKQHETT